MPTLLRCFRAYIHFMVVYRLSFSFFFIESTLSKIVYNLAETYKKCFVLETSGYLYQQEAKASPAKIGGCHTIVRFRFGPVATPT